MRQSLRVALSAVQRRAATGILAAAYGQAGQPAQGLAVLEEALECMHRTGQLSFEAELQRIKGELLLAVSQGNEAEAEDCLRHAIECARRLGAKSYELRAALSLSRLWREQGKHAEARTLLAEVYGWFTDTSAGPSAEGFGPQAGGLRSAGGFETRDLKQAKALLEELGDTGC